MKRIYSAAALVCVLLLCLTMLPLSAAAADATVTVANATVKPGDTFEVPVTVTHAENVGGVEIHVAYDGNVLECVSASLGDAMSGFMMKNVNTVPANHPNEVWLTALGSNATIEGEAMRITFKVKDDAKSGDTTLTVVPNRLAILVGLEANALSVESVNGIVTIEADDDTVATTTKAPATTTAKKPTTTTAKTPVNTTAVNEQTTTATSADSTTAATKETVPSGMVAVEDENGQTVTRDNGVVVTVPSRETVVDGNGETIKDDEGNPVMVPTIALMLDEKTGKPGETVTIEVAISAVADLTALGVSVEYDTDALTFAGGECIGFVKKHMTTTNVAENQKGTVEIAALSAEAVSGSGAIAQLHFTVNDDAKNGDYRLSVASKPLFQAGMMELPYKLFAGRITVEGGRESGNVFEIFGLGAGVGVGVLVAVAVIGIPLIFVTVMAILSIRIVRRRKAEQNDQQSQ